MAIFGWFRSPRQRALDLLGKMYGVATAGMTPMTEAQEWVEELNPRDPRRKRVPKALLDGDYHLISRNRGQGVVFRVDDDHVEVRLPFDLVTPDGLRLPNSHLLRRLPIRALLALGDQRAQKVIENIVKDAMDAFQTHHKTCKVCFERHPPVRYPGHPNEGVLGPPARRYFVCDKCHSSE